MTANLLIKSPSTRTDVAPAPPAAAFAAPRLWPVTPLLCLRRAPKPMTPQLSLRHALKPATLLLYLHRASKPATRSALAQFRAFPERCCYSSLLALDTIVTCRRPPLLALATADLFL
ncbi:hypothetical protein EUGRSUZ_J02641 [Eucalyptus grandis]|uniref:Uncharacterized protein n=2 Tax=Eucalyptus grandis TaxID=71139 RepID=A0ACC3K336_EUCGR|nr:hypothetical protein EUGRSUZ_J02641 [Eucalyptus grandis]